MDRGGKEWRGEEDEKLGGEQDCLTSRALHGTTLRYGEEEERSGREGERRERRMRKRTGGRQHVDEEK